MSEWSVYYTPSGGCVAAYKFVGRRGRSGNKNRGLYLELTSPVIGSDSPQASDRERIAKFVSHLPSDRVLAQVKTLPVLHKFFDYQDFAIRVAQCFLSGRGQLDDPLAEPLNSGEIDQMYYDATWLFVKHCEDLWRLLLTRKEQIIKALKQGCDCPFDSIRELMQEILKEHWDDSFSLYLQDFYHVKPRDKQRLATLQSRGCKGGEVRP